MSSQYSFSDEQALSKGDLRAKMRESRRQLGAHSRAVAARLIVDKLHLIIVDNAAKKIGLYLATAYEVNLDSLIDRSVTEEREIYLPHLADPPVPFRQFEAWDQTEIGSRNLRHPASHTSALKAEKFDIIVLPGLAFDRFGNRLGQGGGWYDRALSGLEQSSKRPLLVGVCFEEQLIENVPRETFDVRMNIVVTPTDIILLS